MCAVCRIFVGVIRSNFYLLHRFFRKVPSWQQFKLIFQLQGNSLQGLPFPLYYIFLLFIYSDLIKLSLRMIYYPVMVKIWISHYHVIVGSLSKNDFVGLNYDSSKVKYSNSFNFNVFEFSVLKLTFWYPFFFIFSLAFLNNSLHAFFHSTFLQEKTVKTRADVNMEAFLSTKRLTIFVYRKLNILLAIDLRSLTCLESSQYF